MQVPALAQLHCSSPKNPVPNRQGLTGLAMTQIMASGQFWAQAAARVATMVALVLNRSSRVMPGSDRNQRKQAQEREGPRSPQLGAGKNPMPSGCTRLMGMGWGFSAQTPETRLI